MQWPAGVVPVAGVDSASASPWVFWYLMYASYSREGITADLEAMKEAGIAGAYLATIKGKTDPPLFEPAIEALTPPWWDLMRFIFEEADRLGIKIALLPNDGFATAGGPWITPELSMQHVVWSDTVVAAGASGISLARPDAYMDYYRDLRTYAFPVDAAYGVSSLDADVTVTTSTGADARMLNVRGNTENFGSNEPMWIQYAFDRPFTCRSINIHVGTFSIQGNRLVVEVSDDGEHFRRVAQLSPPRAGWLDWDAGVTHAIPQTTARYFRFVYDPEGSEPGAEDLDAAKWKPGLKLQRIALSGTPKLHQFEGKSGRAWRVSPRTTDSQVPDAGGIPMEEVVDLTDRLDASGRLDWKAPGTGQRWAIIRMGYTSTGHKNETAGAGKGLECDKFNPEAVKLQFAQWFMKAKEVAGPELAARVLSTFHVDSWECGSQNWSPVFRAEFEKRRGYDPLRYLPAMAGVPVGGIDHAESFLYDVRQTIAELVQDNFFTVLRTQAHGQGVAFSAETTAPVMLSDGLAHYGAVDVPMGEYWLRSPSHDKPNDMLDAISGAHIYGKPVVQAEAFTQIRMAWDEHPGNLRRLQDRNYAMGINNLVYHVFAHNPWVDRKPGMTLDGIGLYFQRDQTWWKPGKAWVAYARRNHALLQAGHPVRDIAVFIGEELPRRSMLPDRLVGTLPGLFGRERVAAERIRLANEGNPTQRVAGVTTGANMAQPERWIDPLRGYAYDCFNPDVLINSARVIDGKVQFADGNAYAVLVLPGKHPMQPHPELMTAETAVKLLQLIEDGAVVVLGERPIGAPGLAQKQQADSIVRAVAAKLFDGPFTEVTQAGQTMLTKRIGKGRVIKGPYVFESLAPFGIQRDVLITDDGGQPVADVAWNHRREGAVDRYFISNQLDSCRRLNISFRVTGKYPTLYDAVTGGYLPVVDWNDSDGRTTVTLDLVGAQSLYVLFCNEAVEVPRYEVTESRAVEGPWSVAFDPAYGGPEETVIFDELMDWTAHTDSRIMHYSGTASYRTTFDADPLAKGERLVLALGTVHNLAEIVVNGRTCGVVWTPPCRVDMTEAVVPGRNTLEIKVTNTWANRLIGDHKEADAAKRVTQTTAPYRLLEELYPAGLLGPVRLVNERQIAETK